VTTTVVVASERAMPGCEQRVVARGAGPPHPEGHVVSARLDREEAPAAPTLALGDVVTPHRRSGATDAHSRMLIIVARQVPGPVAVVVADGLGAVTW